MKTLITVFLAMIFSSIQAETWRCETNGIVEFTDQLCAGGEPVDLPKAQPSTPKAQPGKLVIIDRSSGHQSQLSKSQKRKIRGNISELEKLNKKLRARIREVRQRKEKDLAGVPPGSSDRYSQMTTINIYWNEKIQMLERQYDRNLREISRWRSLVTER